MVRSSVHQVTRTARRTVYVLIYLRGRAPVTHTRTHIHTRIDKGRRDAAPPTTTCVATRSNYRVSCIVCRVSCVVCRVSRMPSRMYGGRYECRIVSRRTRCCTYGAWCPVHRVPTYGFKHTLRGTTLHTHTHTASPSPSFAPLGPSFPLLGRRFAYLCAFRWEKAERATHGTRRKIISDLPRGFVRAVARRACIPQISIFKMETRRFYPPFTVVRLSFLRTPRSYREDNANVSPSSERCARFPISRRQGGGGGGGNV